MFVIFISHPCHNPSSEILDFLKESSQELHILNFWNPNLSKFLRDNGVLWSKQRTTKGKALVIEGADNFSSHGFTDLIGMIDNGFSRDLVIIVSGVHKIPEHILERGVIVYSKITPKMKPEWKKTQPSLENYEEWVRIMRS